MNYSVFSDHIQGNSHKALGMPCEDDTAHYCDPGGRFAIAAVCDGHSDPRCFRSSTGAQFGCETAVELLKNFFTCYEDDVTGDCLAELLDNKERALMRLRAAFVTKWNQRVEVDIQEHPITKEELDGIPASYQRDREIYERGHRLSTIYGATMLAGGVCQDFHVVMHIGDGIIVRLDQKGVYNTPLPEDFQEDGIDSPESMCDTDLLSRPGAFRIDFFAYRPQAIFCMSDGVGDMPLGIRLRKNLLQLHRGLSEKADASGGGLTELNEAQQAFLHSFVEYFSKQGLEDDCSIAGFYITDMPAEDISLSKSEVDAEIQRIEEAKAEEELYYNEAHRRVSEAKEKAERTVQSYQKQLDKLQWEIDRISKALGLAEEDVLQFQRSLENAQKEHEQKVENYAKGRETVESLYTDYEAGSQFVKTQEEAAAETVPMESEPVEPVAATEPVPTELTGDVLQEPASKPEGGE